MHTTVVIIGAGQAGLAMSSCLDDLSIAHVLLERALAPVKLLGLLDRQLDLLVRPGRTGSRHHSLRSVIQSSYDPLTPELQQFLRSLAVMSAPFDLGLAHSVASTSGTELDSLDLISELVDASLVEVREDGDGDTQYRLLDSIRAFGREQLEEAGETHDVSERYVDAVTATAVEIVIAALSSFTPELLRRIRSQFSHLMNAINWCIEHDESPARSYQMFLPFYGPAGARVEIAELARGVRDAGTSPRHYKPKRGLSWGASRS
jgi:predicted ATPase